LVDIDMFGVK